MEKKLEDYESVKKWSLYGNRGKAYKKSTQNVHLKYMNLWCTITELNPDELAVVKELPKARGVISKGLREQKMRVVTVILRINALNAFWRINGRVINDEYEGIGPHLYKEIKKRSASAVDDAVGRFNGVS